MFDGAEDFDFSFCVFDVFLFHVFETYDFTNCLVTRRTFLCEKYLISRQREWISTLACPPSPTIRLRMM
jgi:hypothetical protein